MNKVQLHGRVGNDPEVRSLNGGGQVASFRMATEESWKSGDEWKKRTTWHTVETFREADIKALQTHVKKGGLVRVDGMIRTEEWTDREGQKRFSTKVALSERDHGLYLDPRDFDRTEKEG